MYELFCNLIGRATHRMSAHIQRVAKTKWPTVLLRSDKEANKTFVESAVSEMQNKSAKYEIKIFRGK